MAYITFLLNEMSSLANKDFNTPPIYDESSKNVHAVNREGVNHARSFVCHVTGTDDTYVEQDVSYENTEEASRLYDEATPIAPSIPTGQVKTLFSIYWTVFPPECFVLSFAV